MLIEFFNIYTEYFMNLSTSFLNLIISQKTMDNINQQLGVSSESAGMYLEGLLDYKFLPLLYIILLAFGFTIFQIRKYCGYDKKNETNSLFNVLIEAAPNLLILYLFQLIIVSVLFIVGGFKVTYIFYLSNYTPSISYSFVVCYLIMTLIICLIYIMFIVYRLKDVSGLTFIWTLHFIMLSFVPKIIVMIISLFIPVINIFINVSSPLKAIGNQFSNYTQPFFNMSMYKIGEGWISYFFVGGTVMQILYNIVLVLYSIFIMIPIFFIVRCLNYYTGFFVINHLSKKNKIN